jgi:GNAT superfamily N-acetyltransferase
MGLTIAIDSPQNTEHAAAWHELGAYDPTRLSAEHEWSLVQELGQLGAKMGLVFFEGKPWLRFLMHYFLPAEGTASLGFFAMHPDSDDAFIQKGFLLALQRMTSPEVRKLVGPMNGNTWFSYRLRVDQHPLQFDWEPKTQPWLQALLRTAGFANWAHYHSIATAGLKGMKAYLEKDWKRVTDRGLTIRPVGLSDLKAGALLDLHRLSQIGFAANPLFVPLSFEAFARSYVEGKSDKENFISMAYDTGGRAVAFFLAFLEPPHPGETQKTLVLKTAATDPDYRRQGLSNALLYDICSTLPDHLSDNYISALVFQGWNSESYARHGKIFWEHQYVLMARDEG